jgi:two-component system NtrC family sensor kinase
MSQIKDADESALVEMGAGQKISLILISKIQTTAKKVAGFSEQLIQIDQNFLNSIKNRMDVELAIIRNNGNVLASTQQDFYDYKKKVFLEYIEHGGTSTFELDIRSVPYQFYILPVSWGKTNFYIAVGASKGHAKAAMKGVNYAFYLVVLAAIIMAIVAIFIITNTIIKPLDELVQATRDLPYKDNLVDIPRKSDNEIGLLSDSFNEMSRQILRIRAELKAKIHELEVANKEIKETQVRLVHSSKMSSLGQLVAGVAHELNNPISFIYSNMSHLREYGEKLIQIVEVAEKDPTQISRVKAEIDLNYIKTDLPKLISSCEDGARRVRDIVLGLRNFSRLDESKLKEIDFNEELDNTLNLLAGEIKNRIQIHKYYGDLPKVNCFATQINQVFMNILSNAVQAIEGNGNLWITTKKTGSTVGKDKEMVVVSIQDSGKGIAPNVVDKIFDPFFSTKGVGQGTGLGLSISYGIIQSHGGDILVKSQVGIGTEFIISVPLKIDRKDSKNGKSEVANKL